MIQAIDAILCDSAWLADLDVEYGDFNFLRYLEDDRPLDQLRYLEDDRPLDQLTEIADLMESEIQAAGRASVRWEDDFGLKPSP